MSEDVQRQAELAVAQLRHTYIQPNLDPGIKRGLLGPAIEKIERYMADRDAQVREAFMAGYHAYGPENVWKFVGPMSAQKSADNAFAAFLATRQPKEPA